MPTEIAEDALGRYEFDCHEALEYARVGSFFTKEPGTVAWLRHDVMIGDVVYDIGANIGLYTVLAATLVGKAGHVYAFEPHLVNAARLLRNVEQNGLGDRVTLVTSPVGGLCGWRTFYSRSLAAGTSGHQLGESVDEAGQPFQAMAAELRWATTLDALAIPPPTHVKIDIDGREPDVLDGLTFHGELLSLQVEAHPHTASGLHARLAKAGFRVARHETSNGMAKIAAGADPATVPHNLLARR